MVKRREFLALLLAPWLTSCQSAGAGKGSVPAGLDLGSLDRAVRPQDDLYRFAAGTWLRDTSIPPDRSNYGAFSVLQDEAYADVRTIAEEAAAGAATAPAGSDTQRIGDLPELHGHRTDRGRRSRTAPARARPDRGHRLTGGVARRHGALPDTRRPRPARSLRVGRSRSAGPPRHRLLASGDRPSRPRLLPRGHSAACGVSSAVRGLRGRRRAAGRHRRRR